MSKTLHLRRKKGAYYWRRKIPSSLIKRIGRIELVRSLHTSDPKLARLRCRLMGVASDKLFAMIEQQITLTTEQIDELLRRDFTECLQADEEQRLRATPSRSVYTTTPDGFDQSPQSADLDALTYLLSDAVEDLLSNNIRSVKHRIATLVPECEEGSTEYLYAGRGLLRLNVELLQMTKARLAGNYALLPKDPLFAADALPPVQPDASEVTYSDPPLSVVVPKYLAWLESQDEISKHNIGQRKGTLRMLSEFLGEPPVNSINRMDLVEYREAMRALPSKHGQMNGWKSLTVPEKAAKAEGGELPDGTPLLSDKRIKSQFSEINGLFHWLMDLKEYDCDSSPVRDFKWRKAKAARLQRVPFEPEELLTLFSQPIWQGSHHHFRTRQGSHIIKDAQYFLPLIALYSGMRLGEISQLYLDDIRQSDEGVWYMDINDNKDKSVKNEVSVRYVPVHPELERLGFIDYYKKMLSKGEERLWPDVQPAGVDRRYGVYPSKQFQAVRAAAGLTRESLCFHSFRHTFATALHNSCTDDTGIPAVLGHARGVMSFDRYSMGLKDIERLYECVCQVQFDVGL